MPVTAEQKDRLFKAADAGQLEDFQAAAAELGFDDIKQLKADNGADCLHIAAHGGRTELCKYLLEQLHFDVNAQEGVWRPRQRCGVQRRTWRGMRRRHRRQSAAATAHPTRRPQPHLQALAAHRWRWPAPGLPYARRWRSR